MRSQTQPLVLIALLTLGAFAVSYAIPTILEWWVLRSTSISAVIVVGDLWPSVLIAWMGRRRKAVFLYAGLAAAKSLLLASRIDASVLKSILLFGSDLVPSVFVTLHINHAMLLTLLDE